MRKLALAFVLTLGLAACETPGPVSTPVPPAPAPEQTPSPPEEPPRKPSGPARPPPPAARHRTLGPAAGALVAQAKQQSAAGNHALAASTIERALRVSPNHPLLWIELGRIRLAQKNPAQAETMGRKALAAAADDRSAQAAAWKLIAEANRAQRRTSQAREADANAARLGAGTR